MKFTWVKVENDEYEAENLLIGIGAIRVATIEKDITTRDSIMYVGYSDLPSLKELFYNPCKDTLKNKIIDATVEWFTKTN